MTTFPDNWKAHLRLQLLESMRAELLTIERSAAAAYEGATHADVKPENKYDTRGLESSYLAGAQNERAGEWRTAILAIESMPLLTFGEDSMILASAVVTLASQSKESWYFLVPLGAGVTLKVEGITIVTITTQSPLGENLIKKYLGDEVELRLGAQKTTYEIVGLY